jgi:hypothetical protein
MDRHHVQVLWTPGYMDLRTLAAYSCCSVRWLRDRLADRAKPLPYHRIEGKILIRKEDFDEWIGQYRTVQPPDELAVLVDGVLEDVCR